MLGCLECRVRRAVRSAAPQAKSSHHSTHFTTFTLLLAERLVQQVFRERLTLEFQQLHVLFHPPVERERDLPRPAVDIWILSIVASYMMRYGLTSV